MNTLYLVRHCQATGQEALAPLTIEGSKQAQALCHFFKNKPIDQIISSPFKRAVDTIAPLARLRNLPLHTDDRLSERILSPQDRDDWLMQLERTFEDLDYVLEGGESSQTAINRITAVMNEQRQNDATTSLILVTHGNLLSLLLKSVGYHKGFQDWRKLTNPDVFKISFKPEMHTQRIWE
ncbi:phosphoglycerate mutase [Fictibacillus macauensis ZFHKF-1]|uniref:Phosphoglycerate mutase n=1 Tax=Fictibacillus macauensis ZFHKF-1 TaxID=1196324 RepID=I8J215_9BACL|nr:histidine phosphatase family protein [Fictibacillus macauensis]EIT85791.1 phosphoglycerate mutase [Fictibacillus macauensis ZFHKF-1]